MPSTNEIIAILVLIVSIVILTSSTYGIGKSESDPTIECKYIKTGEVYEKDKTTLGFATIIAGISGFAALISLVYIFVILNLSPSTRAKWGNSIANLQKVCSSLPDIPNP